MVGESECSSGFPMIPTSRVLPSMCIVFSRGCTRVRRSSGFLERLRPFKYPLEQRQKDFFDVLQLSRVTLNDIHITDVVNVVSHRVRRHAVFAVRPGEAHHVRLIGHALKALTMPSTSSNDDGLLPSTSTTYPSMPSESISHMKSN